MQLRYNVQTRNGITVKTKEVLNETQAQNFKKEILDAKVKAVAFALYDDEGRRVKTI